MKTLIKWLNKEGYEFTYQTLLNGEYTIITIDNYVIEMEKRHRGGYITSNKTGFREDFSSVKEIQEMIKNLIK